jgi:FkbM family methyltransferase
MRSKCEAQVRHECWPSSFGDRLVSLCSYRFGRMDRYQTVARMRRAILSAAARPSMAVRYDTCYGFQLLLPVWDPSLVGAAAEGRIFDNVLTEVLRRVIRPGDTVVDGGANVGFYSLLAASLLNGKGQVISFEPDPRNLPLLRANADLNRFSGMLRVEPMALSSSEGDLHFWYNPQTSWGGSLVEIPSASDICVTVPATSLDVFRSKRNLAPIDIIKLDLEGAEPLALQGMEESLSSARFLALEINQGRLVQLKVDAARLVNDILEQGRFTVMLLCDGHNVKLSKPHDSHWTLVLERLGWADVFCGKGEAADQMLEFISFAEAGTTRPHPPNQLRRVS